MGTQIEPVSRKKSTLGSFLIEFVSVENVGNGDYFFSGLSSPFFAAVSLAGELGSQYVFPPTCVVDGQKITIHTADFFAFLGWRPAVKISAGIFIVGV